LLSNFFVLLAPAGFIAIFKSLQRKNIWCFIVDFSSYFVSFFEYYFYLFSFYIYNFPCFKRL
jgi:hypothetical protein